MLYNLKVELIRKGLNPIKAISQTINCNDNISENKLNGLCEISIQEAIKIKDTYFLNDNISIHYLFSSK